MMRPPGARSDARLAKARSHRATCSSTSVQRTSENDSRGIASGRLSSSAPRNSTVPAAFCWTSSEWYRRPAASNAARNGCSPHPASSMCAPAGGACRASASTTASRRSGTMNRSSRDEGSYVERRIGGPASRMESAPLCGVAGTVAHQRPLGVLEIGARSVFPVVILPLDPVHRDDERAELRETLEFREGPAVGEERANREAALVCAERRYVKREPVAAGIAPKARVALEAPEVADAALIRVDYLEREAERARGFGNLELELEPNGQSPAVHASRLRRDDARGGDPVSGRSRRRAVRRGHRGMRGLHRPVVRDAVGGRAVEHARAPVEHQCALREFRDRLHVVAHEEHSAAGVRDLFHLAEAF